MVFSSTYAAQGSQCRSLFKPPLSHNQIDITIRRLAELRMSIDIHQSQGSQNPVNMKAKADFDFKYLEFVSRLEDQLAEGQIRQLIVKEIRKKQGLEEIRKDDEMERRKLEINTLGRFGKFDLPTEIVGVKRGTYSPATDSLLIVAGFRKLWDFSLKNQYAHLISVEYTDHVVQGDSILLRQGLGGSELVRYNLKTHHKEPLFKDFGFTRKELSPDGRHVAILNEGVIYFYDSITQRKLSPHFAEWKPAPKQGVLSKLLSFGRKNQVESHVEQFRFVSENLVLIRGNIGTRAVVFDMTTGKTSEIPFGKFNPDSLVVENNMFTFIHKDNNRVGRIHLQDFADFDNKIIEMPVHKAFPELDPSDQIQVMQILPDHTLQVSTYPPTNHTLRYKYDDLSLVQEHFWGEEDTHYPMAIDNSGRLFTFRPQENDENLNRTFYVEASPK